MPKTHGQGRVTGVRARARAGAGYKVTKSEPAKTGTVAQTIQGKSEFEHDPETPSQLDASPPVDDGPVTRQEFENLKADLYKELSKKANSSSLSQYQKKTAKKKAAKSTKD